jgi:hypothetical protein
LPTIAQKFCILAAKDWKNIAKIINGQSGSQSLAKFKAQVHKNMYLSLY